VPRDPLIDALVAELNQAIAATRAARKLIADLQKQRRVEERARSRAGDGGPDLETIHALRFGGMTVAEAAAVLRVSDERVRVMARKKELRGAQLGGRIGWRLDRDHILRVAAEWEAQRRGQTTARARRRS
jgi:excisionase family DNA binding protein